MTNIETISIKKAQVEAEKINSLIQNFRSQFGTYQSSMNINKIREEITNSFGYHFMDKNHNIDLERLNISKEDKEKLKFIDNYFEFETIYSKYVGKKSAEIKLDQMNISLTSSIYEAEATKIAKATKDKYFSVYDYRRKIPINEIIKLLNVKTKSYVTIHISDMTYGYETFRQLAEVIRITTGININHGDMIRQYGMTIDTYNKKLNSLNPYITFTAFANGNMRISISDPAVYNELRSYLINKEIQAIHKLRSN